MRHDIDDAIHRLRLGDDLRVQSIKDVGPNLSDALERIDNVHAKGGAVIDSQGRKSTDGRQLVPMLREALPKMRKGLTTRQARANGKRGRKRQERMPDEQAKAFWTDRDILTNAKALTFMPGWSWQMAYRAFGASGRPTNKGARKRRKSK